MNRGAVFPGLYPILDCGFLPSTGEIRRASLRALVQQLSDAGVGILQYRNKAGSEADILADAREMRVAASGGRVRLILNDWPELAVKASFDGVHIGQDDVTPAEARRIVGPHRMIGLSTHNEAQLLAADQEPVDYIAIGPVFSTLSKAKPDPVVGLEGVRTARRLTSKPLVAIGGITLVSAAQVKEAGADSVAVISAIFSRGSNPASLAKDFLRILE